tara:strand:- start:2664 stop:3077 length:414 start_codon:yes stop_codon:yes gene_type:complete
MGTRVNHYFHSVSDDTSLTSVGTSFDASKKHTIKLGSFPDESRFIGKISAVTIHVSSIASSASQVSFRMTSDSTGDKTLLSGLAGDLDVGITTATDGSVTYVFSFIQSVPTNDTVYLFYKTNTGTVTIDEVIITWEE